MVEGRRIYVGNILYHVRPDEITKALEEAGFTDYEQVHISVDPVTGRNPGYCFVEFETRASADRAIDAMSGVEIHGRPLKTGPCKPKNARGPSSYQPTFNRWGDWSGADNGAALTDQGPAAAMKHLSDALTSDQKKRLYVGGLGRMINQVENDKEIRGLFAEYQM